MAAVHGPLIPRHPSPFRRVYKAPSNPHSHRPQSSINSHPDPYHGHEEMAKLCARFVSHVFTCPEFAPPSSSTSGKPTTSSSAPPLSHFVAYALHRTRLHSSVTFTALALLHRLKSRFPAARGSSGHRLFLSAFMIASKVVCDDTYSNKSWAVVGQNMFALREINQMEREMCQYLEWHLNISNEELTRFEREVRSIYSKPPPYTQSIGSITGLGLVFDKEAKESDKKDVSFYQQLPTPTDIGVTKMPFSMRRSEAVSPLSTSPSKKVSHLSSIPPIAPKLSASASYPSPPTTPPSPIYAMRALGAPRPISSSEFPTSHSPSSASSATSSPSPSSSSTVSAASSACSSSNTSPASDGPPRTPSYPIEARVDVATDELPSTHSTFDIGDVITGVVDKLTKMQSQPLFRNYSIPPASYPSHRYPASRCHPSDADDVEDDFDLDERIVRRRTSSRGIVPEMQLSTLGAGGMFKGTGRSAKTYTVGCGW